MFVQATAFLPDDRLRELARCEDLDSVRHLAMSVDTSENSLNDLGHRLPALTQLRLDGSNISTPRDLGTGLGGLRVLWLARSGLRELEGIGAFGALTELYIAFNEIDDLSSLMAADRLQVLDLEANAVADEAQVHYLMGCSELHSLTLDGNPIADRTGYRKQVLHALPQLAYLDDEAADSGADAERAAAESTAAAIGADGMGGVREATSSVPGPTLPPLRSAGGAVGATLATDAAPAAGTPWRRELRLVVDGIKYADTLREYDVESREALTMVRARSRARARARRTPSPRTLPIGRTMMLRCAHRHRAIASELVWPRRPLLAGSADLVRARRCARQLCRQRGQTRPPPQQRDLHRHW